MTHEQDVGGGRNSSDQNVLEHATANGNLGSSSVYEEEREEATRFYSQKQIKLQIF